MLSKKVLTFLSSVVQATMVTRGRLLACWACSLSLAFWWAWNSSSLKLACANVDAAAAAAARRGRRLYIISFQNVSHVQKNTMCKLFGTCELAWTLAPPLLPSVIPVEVPGTGSVDEVLCICFSESSPKLMSSKMEVHLLFEKVHIRAVQSRLPDKNRMTGWLHHCTESTWIDGRSWINCFGGSMFKLTPSVWASSSKILCGPSGQSIL